MSLVLSGLALFISLYCFYLAYILWNISDEDYERYRKLLLDPDSDTTGDTIQTIFRDENGNICVRRRVSIGATKRFLNKGNPL